jgi:hypothetical protein
MQQRAIFTKLRDPRGTDCRETRHVDRVFSLTDNVRETERREEERQGTNLIGEEFVVHNIFR